MSGVAVTGDYVEFGTPLVHAGLLPNGGVSAGTSNGKGRERLAGGVVSGFVRFPVDPGYSRMEAV